MIGAGLTAASVLVGIRQKQRTGEQYLIYCMLAIVFLSVFGFYALWGEGFIKYILSSEEENSYSGSLPRFLQIMSLPFILAAWLMLILLKNAISLTKWPAWLLSAILASALTLVILAGLFPFNLDFSGHTMDSQRLVIAVLNLAFCIYTGLALIFFRQERSEWAESRPVFWLGFACLLQGVLQAPVMALPGITFWTDALFMKLFFISLPLPMFILHRSPLIKKKSTADQPEIKGFKAFCREYDISPREAEIVLEICHGKSNREIADTLFISLQTVKDHAHRIFYKTGVKSRVQLANLVRERESAH